MIDLNQFTNSRPAPRFKPLPKTAHTFFSPEQIAEDCDYENEIGLTPLGETINRGMYSGDLFFIFDPDCKAIERNGDKGWQFLEANPGEYGYRNYMGKPDPSWPKRLGICTIWSHHDLLVARLLESKASFQFITAPGTERETRIRVKPTGAIQRFIQNYEGRLRYVETSFSLRVEEGVRNPDVHLMHKVTGETVIHWTHNDQPTGEKSKARQALFSQRDLEFAGDLFYALSALDAEALAAYGRILELCCVCGRGLRDAASIQRGVGPDCWRAITTGSNLLRDVLPQQEVAA